MNPVWNIQIHVDLDNFMSFQTVPKADFCSCNTDNCNVAIDLGTRKCYHCSNEEKLFECENPDAYGNEVICDGFCFLASYSK